MEPKISFYAIVFITAYFIISKKLSSQKIPREEIALCLVQTLVAAIFMARFAHALLDKEMILASLLFPTRATWYGALLGASPVLWYWSKKWNKMSPWIIVDNFSLYAPLFYSLFRITCFLEGHCIGTPSEVSWAVTYPGLGTTVHPVQLYDSYLNFCLFIALIEFNKRKSFDGQLTLLFLILHGLIRFFTEYFRWGVSAAVVGGVITQAQIASIVIITGSLVAWKVLKKQAIGNRHEARNQTIGGRQQAVG